MPFKTIQGKEGIPALAIIVLHGIDYMVNPNIQKKEFKIISPLFDIATGLKTSIKNDYVEELVTTIRPLIKDLKE